MKPEKTITIKLQWKQISVIAAICVSVVGTSFGTGVKVQSQISKVAMLENDRKWQQTVAAKELELIEANRKTREANENSAFYRHQYIFMKQQLENKVGKIDEQTAYE